jgi:hypothetical protein
MYEADGLRLLVLLAGRNIGSAGGKREPRTSEPFE